MNSQYAPDGVFIQVKPERQVDLLGDAGTSISRVALLHFYDGFNDVSGWPLWPWLPSPKRRIQQPVLSFLECIVKMEQGRWLDDDS